MFSWLLYIVMAVIGFEIVMRLFGKAQIWVYDITLNMAGVTYVLGGAYTLLRNAHVKMDILYNHFSPRTQAILDVITFPGIFIFCGILLWAGGFRAWESFLVKERLVTASMMIVWPVRLMVPLGGLLILLQYLAKFIRDFHMAVKGERLD